MKYDPVYVGLRDVRHASVEMVQKTTQHRYVSTSGGKLNRHLPSLSCLNRNKAKKRRRDCGNDSQDQSFFFNDWKPQIWQYQFLFLKTTIWSEIHLTLWMSRPSLFPMGDFFVFSVFELPKTEQDISVQPNQDTRIEPAQLHRPWCDYGQPTGQQQDRPGGGKYKVDTWAELTVACLRVSLTFGSRWYSNPLERNTWKPKSSTM